MDPRRTLPWATRHLRLFRLLLQIAGKCGFQLIIFSILRFVSKLFCYMMYCFILLPSYCYELACIHRNERNGWWNYTINDCSYWIPPPPTPQPTVAPFACPSCDTQPLSTKSMVSAALVGAVAALALNWLVKKMCGRGDGYTSLP